MVDQKVQATKRKKAVRTTYVGCRNRCMEISIDVLWYAANNHPDGIIRLAKYLGIEVANVDPKHLARLIHWNITRPNSIMRSSWRTVE